MSPRSFRRRCATLLAASCLAAACADTSGPGAPAVLEVTQPGPPDMPVGAVVSGAEVRVLDAAGRAVPGVEIAFQVVAGEGSLAAGSATSDAAGRAPAPAWTLGTVPGVQRLRAAAEGVAPVELEVLTRAAAAHRLGFAVRPPEVYTQPEPPAAAPVVQVEDAYGNAVAQGGTRVQVTFASPGGIALEGGNAVTDATGRASFAQLRLSGRAAPLILRFTTAGLLAAEAPVELVAGPPVRLELAEPPWSLDASGPLTNQPVVEAEDAWGNRAAAHGIVAAQAISGGSVAGGGSATMEDGRATFTGLAVAGTGPVVLRFSSGTLDAVEAAAFVPGEGMPCLRGARLGLDRLAPGELVQFQATEAAAPVCLDFLSARAAGGSFLVQVESLPPTGPYGTALFPGAPSSSGSWSVAAEGGPMRSGLAGMRQAPPVAGIHAPLDTAGGGWDFGAGELREGLPELPAGVRPRAELVRGGTALGLAAVRSDMTVGDTVQAWMEGIERLGIARGWQRAVVRHVSDRLVIAEDVRLGTLTRESGGVNTPLTAAQLNDLATEFAAYGGPQGDRLYGGRFNAAIEGGTPPRVMAIHSLMYSDGIWGYTYPAGDYFVWDFWAGTDGRTPGLNQHPHRVADHLMTHEVAHLRHWGVQERAGRTDVRGQRWLVEGFARHNERWAVAARLLGTSAPSRIGNVVLPLNPAYGGSYVRDAVPTYLYAPRSFTAGYAGSSYLFDYLADQVAWAGGDWLAALVNFVARGGVAADADAAVAGAGITSATLRDLITRARIALWADDHRDYPDLAPWTQYHQFQLRASRPPGGAQASDPRALWPVTVPGASNVHGGQVDPGGAWAFVIDGRTAGGDGRYILSYPALQDAFVTVTRLR